MMSMKGQAPVHVLAIGPAIDTKLVLRVLRAGADDYVDSAFMETELKDALRRWRTKVTKASVTGKLISLISPNGGCGVSTLAVNLAIALAAEQERVLLVDLHLNTDDLASLLDLKPVYSIANLCQSTSGIDHSLFEKALTPHESGVHLLAPPRRIEDSATVTPRGVCQVLVMARSEFPFVVVDLDVDSGETMQEVLIQSDLILLVLKPDVISLRNAKRLLGRLEWLGISPLSIRTVLSRVGQSGEVAAAKVEAALRTKVFHIMPEDLKVVNNCNNMGVPVIREAPRSKFATALHFLVSEIHNVLASAPAPIQATRAAKIASDRRAHTIEELRNTPEHALAT
jgi:pilus assembly protein CpaE